MAGTALLWAIGAVLIAALLMSAAWPEAIETSSPRRRPRKVLIVVAALTAVSGGWLGYARWQDHPPYAPAAIGATATVRLTDDAQFGEDARALGVTGLGMVLNAPGSQNFVGRIDYTVPKDVEAGGYYHVIVVNRRDDQASPLLFGTDGGGWDGFLDNLPRRYPWLSALTPVPDNDPYHDPSFHTGGQAVTSPADAAGPIAFVGVSPAPRG